MRYFHWNSFLVLVFTSVILPVAALGQAGFLDPSFGGTGMIQFGFGGAQEEGQATAVQSDGSLLIAGIRQDTSQIAVLRLGTNNLPDPTFGSGGLATLTPALPIVQVSGVAEQADGKIVVAGTVYGSGEFNRDFMVARFNSDGSVDSSFGTGGLVSRDMDGSSDDFTYGLAIQPDGKIVIAGTATASPNFNPAEHIALARFDTNGNGDFSFGSGGIFVITNYSAGYAMALEGDGNILVGGYFGNTAIVRVTTNGTLDTTFGSGGSATIPTGGQITAVAIQPGGLTILQPAMIVAAGISSSSVVVARLSLSGVLDTNFSGVGYVTKSVVSNPRVTGLACFASGFVTRRTFKFLVSGDVYNGSEYFVTRVNADGSTDTSLGGSGAVLTSIANSAYAQDNGLAVLPGGRFVLAGTLSPTGCGSDFLVARYNYADGSLDTNFYGGGILSTNVGQRNAEANSVAIQADGKIVLAGHCTDGCGYDVLALCRLNSDGTFDSSFGNKGTVVTNLTSLGSPMVIQPDGRIIVAGAAYDGVANYSVTLTRFLSTGALDASFGSGGVATNIVGTNSASPTAIALQSNGKIVVGASTSVSGNDIAILRCNTNGALDTTWNGSGKVFTVIGSSGDQMGAVAVQSDGKVIDAGLSGFSTVDKFSMVRCATNGTLDNSFGSFGRVATAVPNETYSGAYGMVLQPDGRIILAGLVAAAPAYQFQLAVLRYNSSGTLDSTFGNGGVAIASIGLANSYGLAPALQRDGKIVIACRAQNGPFYKFAAARFLTNGVIDSAYGFGGVNYFDYGTGADELVNGMALDSVGRMVMVGRAGGLFAVARVSSGTVVQFTSITSLANHHTFLTGTGVPSASHTLLKAAGPLSSFSSLSSVMTDSTGNWQYEDATASSTSAGFYRLSYP
jgi:uncharacterized delta-60 repeat protein